MNGTYNSLLVLVSYIVAVFASFVALDMSSRISASEGRASRWWLIAGSVAMGIGVWSMHFIGMLAFRLPVPQGYDLLVTVYSLLIGIAASGYALYLVSRPQLGRWKLAGGAVVMGAGIATMHYVGMAAMRMEPPIEYDPGWFGASMVIAMAAAGAALWIAHHLRAEGRGQNRNRILASFVMGFAIVGIHYTGMAAAHFRAGSFCSAAIGNGVSQQWLASLVGTASFAILGMALVVSMLDRRLQERTALFSHSLSDAYERLQSMALHDSLTGLPNRSLLEDRIGRAIAKAARDGSRFALMFFDLDGFKAINDGHGHMAGDRMLLQVARKVRETLRAQDTFARIGGDEFVLLIDVSAPEDAIIVAEKLQAVVCEPLQLESGFVGVSASIGIAVYPQDGTDAETLVANADAAMYTVKKEGRRGYRYFEASMNVGARDQFALMRDLRMAVRNSELFLEFQPKRTSAGGILAGVEALLRWRHPTRGLVPPDRFIAIAEKNGLIMELGRWVLDEACRQMAIWREQGPEVPNVAVNLSWVQFHSPVLVEMVSSALLRHDLPAETLTLEITESTVMRDSVASIAILEKLAAIGVRISIAHFGTGYASLMYLSKLPADELKIDRAFIKDLVRGGETAAIISAIVALGRSLHLDVIAEGVETREQQLLLSELGCSSLQGYYMGRPSAADVLAAPAPVTTVCYVGSFSGVDRRSDVDLAGRLFQAAPLAGCGALAYDGTHGRGSAGSRPWSSFGRVLDGLDVPAGLVRRSASPREGPIATPIASSTDSPLTCVDRTLSVAPMMDWTDRHCRFFHRLLSPNALLYTEMVTSPAVVHGDRARLLGFDVAEQPVALQLGGSDPAELAQAARIGVDLGYVEINLNVGCPSDRVQSGRFGACLMREPALVADCVKAMRDAVAHTAVAITVKCRLGVDEQDEESALADFIDAVHPAGCDVFVVHAR
ncbi:MAG: tRNA dihydrouridine(20/20a) synthase DusA, partial [Dokdonella sp.]|uniref:tRNA dihydrouridine(20/20a) synthase DusA n=1 Tax=Dokdonella sp. TaxID=2291710 RepID=UPI003265F21D